MTAGAGEELSLRDAARGPRRRGADASLPAHGRAVLPSAHAIRWVPDDAGGAPPAPAGPEAPYEVFITQAALRALHANVADRAGEPCFGFFAGRLFRCPETRIHYDIVERVIPVLEPFAEDAPQAYLLRAWEMARREFGRRPGVLIGWYHTHELLGPFLSETDAEACERYFGEAWQCAVVIVPGRQLAGGLFRGLGSSAGAVRASPFYEILDPASPGGDVRDVSVLGWRNYRTDQSSVGPGPGPGEGFEQVADRVPATAPTIRLEHTGPVPLVLPSESREPLLPHPSRQTRKTIGGIISLLLIVAAGVVAVRWAKPGPKTAPPFVPVKTTSVQTENTNRELDSLLSALAFAVDQYEERRTDFDLRRIGCELLGGGYAGADRAAIAAAAGFARAVTPPNSASTTEYGRLLGEMDAVNAHFDGSRCPRPR